MPNAWDIGSAALFASLGFEAIATTSGGFAATRGRLDGAMTKEEVLTHGGELAGAVDVPVSADLENCFAHDPEGVAATITAAAGVGLAGGSVEDFTGDRDDPIYELAQAAERVRAAAEAAHAGQFVVDGPGRELPPRPPRTWPTPSPGCRRSRKPEPTCSSHPPSSMPGSCGSCWLPSTSRSASWCYPGAPTVDELGALGVSRISVGGAIAVAAYGAAINAVNELREQGTTSYFELAAVARPVIADAFSR